MFSAIELNPPLFYVQKPRNISLSTLSLFSDLRPIKPQTIADNGYTAHGHGQCCKDGVKLSQHHRERLKRRQYAGCHRDQDDVIYKRQKKILTYRTHGLSTHSNGAWNAAELMTALGLATR
jgi:hypothetical protein